jgi:hypothetical protein
MATYIRTPLPAYYRPPIYPTHPAASYANFGHGHIVQGVRPNLNNNVIGQWSPINPQQADNSFVLVGTLFGLVVVKMTG